MVNINKVRLNFIRNKHEFCIIRLLVYLRLIAVLVTRQVHQMVLWYNPFNRHVNPY